MKTTKKELISFATSVNAIDLTNADSEEVNNIRKNEDIKEVSYAVGVYGVIAWLGVGKSGQYYYGRGRKSHNKAAVFGQIRNSGNQSAERLCINKRACICRA